MDFDILKTWIRSSVKVFLPKLSNHLWQTFTLTQMLMESYKGWEAVKSGGPKINIKKVEGVNA
jgi:hypothetical protein